ncbi:MAG: SHOCT domain-containing protein, partial [Clostridiales bacterium]|nr:SHOCT domain-containing protein [Clostridiales bacterium]
YNECVYLDEEEYFMNQPLSPRGKSSLPWAAAILGLCPAAIALTYLLSSIVTQISYSYFSFRNLAFGLVLLTVSILLTGALFVYAKQDNPVLLLIPAATIALEHVYLMINAISSYSASREAAAENSNLRPYYGWELAFNLFLLFLSLVILLLFAGTAAGLLHKSHLFLAAAIAYYGIITFVHIILVTINTFSYTATYISFSPVLLLQMLALVFVMLRPGIGRADSPVISANRRWARTAAVIVGILNLPAVFAALSNLISTIIWTNQFNFAFISYYRIREVFSYVLFGLYVISLLRIVPIIAVGMMDQSRKQPAARQEMFLHILLYLFFPYVYRPIWIYRISAALPEEQNRHPYREAILSIFIPVYRIIWLYRHAKRLEEQYTRRDIPTNDFSVAYTLLYWLIPIAGAALFQTKINQYCDAVTPPPSPYPAQPYYAPQGQPMQPAQQSGQPYYPPQPSQPMQNTMQSYNTPQAQPPVLPAQQNAQQYNTPGQAQAPQPPFPYQAPQQAQTPPPSQANTQPNPYQMPQTPASAQAIATLEKLAQLRAQGVISQEEFDRKKQELLKEM